MGGRSRDHLGFAMFMNGVDMAIIGRLAFGLFGFIVHGCRQLGALRGARVKGRDVAYA